MELTKVVGDAVIVKGGVDGGCRRRDERKGRVVTHRGRGNKMIRFFFIKHTFFNLKSQIVGCYVATCLASRP